MKKILSVIVFFVFIIAAFAPCVSKAQNHDEIAKQDSILNVIGYFCNRDTVVYWIQDSEWKLTPSDTIQEMGVSTKVMLTVADSTASGYTMNYTFLDFRADSISDSELGNFQNRLVSQIGRKIIGTTIQFETDEYGVITKFNNLGKIKKQAKSIFKDAIKEMQQLPWVKGLKEMGFDLNSYLKNVETDELVEGYIEEIKLLFRCHGYQYKLGETTEHEDATENQYANDTYNSVWVDEDGCYHVSFDVINTIPQDDIKALVSGVVEELSPGTLTESFNSEFDNQVNKDCMRESFLKIDYLPYGWPTLVIKQESTMIGDRGKLKQKYIYIDAYSICNY